MDEAPRQDREAVEGAGEGDEERSPEEIRRDIDQTREDLGDTVAAVAQKADVKAQARGKVEEVKGKLKEATPESASGGAQQVATKTQENPLLLAVGASFAAGMVVGWLLGRR
jgi:ElaB/YqjD/DUF883 family membrane-anchored ribosome-binding protein